MLKSLMTVSEASAILHLHPTTLRNKANSKKIGCVRYSPRGPIYFKESQIQDYLDKKTIAPKPPSDPFLPFPADSAKMDEKGGNNPVGKKADWKISYRGLGSAYLRKDTGKLCISYYDEYGKRQRKTLKGITDTQKAKQILHDKIKESLERRYSPNKKMRIKFTDFAEIYLEKHAKLRKRSWESDERYCRSHLNPFFGHQYIDEIEFKHIQDFIIKKLESGQQKNSVNRYLQIMRSMLNKANDFGYKLDENPIKPGTLFNESEFTRTRTLSHEEEPLLIAELVEHQKPLIPYAILSGCRLQEIRGLWKDDIDFEKNTIAIRPELNKSGKLDFIPIHEELRIFLKAHLKNQNGSKYVFTRIDRKTGEAKPLKDIYRGFHGACERAGIKDFQFRDLRTTAATRWHEKGVDPLIISRAVLRHSTLKMSEKFYIHSQLEFMRKTLDSANGSEKTDTELTRKEKGLMSTPVI